VLPSLARKIRKGERLQYLFFGHQRVGKIGQKNERKTPYFRLHTHKERSGKEWQIIVILIP